MRRDGIPPAKDVNFDYRVDGVRVSFTTSSDGRLLLEHAGQSMSFEGRDAVVSLVRALRGFRAAMRRLAR